MFGFWAKRTKTARVSASDSFYFMVIIHKNAPGAISAITSILTEAHLNIENMVNKGKKDVAYTLLDVTGNVTDDLAVKLGAIEPAIRVRVL